MLGVSDVSSRITTPVNAVAQCFTRMVQLSAFNCNVANLNGLPNFQVMKLKISLHDLEGNGKIWVMHLVSQAFLESRTIRRTRSINMKTISFDKSRDKERYSLNVIPVRVGEKHISFYWHLG